MNRCIEEARALRPFEIATRQDLLLRPTYRHCWTGTAVAPEMPSPSRPRLIRPRVAGGGHRGDVGPAGGVYRELDEGGLAVSLGVGDVCVVGVRRAVATQVLV